MDPEPGYFRVCVTRAIRCSLRLATVDGYSQGPARALSGTAEDAVAHPPMASSGRRHPVHVWPASCSPSPFPESPSTERAALPKVAKAPGYSPPAARCGLQRPGSVPPLCTAWLRGFSETSEDPVATASHSSSPLPNAAQMCCSQNCSMKASCTQTPISESGSRVSSLSRDTPGFGLPRVK